MVWTSGIRAALVALSIVLSFSPVSADVCDEVADAMDLNNTLPLDGNNKTIVLDPSITTLECPYVSGLYRIEVSDGQLTISSSNTVRFVNVGFTVESGGELIFDMPKTKFGPNYGSVYFVSNVLSVSEGGSVIFMGKFGCWGVPVVASYNRGSVEFKGNAKFQDNEAVFTNNEGSLKFRGKTWFKHNFYLAIRNDGPDAFVRFSKDVVFQDNGRSYIGADGCSIWNDVGNVVFRGDAYFKDTYCDGGGAVWNGDRMRFYGKAIFTNNTATREWGGGLQNKDGTLVFRAATQFNNNHALVGGGMAVTGGEVTFKKAVMFDGNVADENGGAFALTMGGQYGSEPTTPSSLTFEMPSVVRYSDNEAPVNACTLAYVEDGTILVGFDVDDVCLENTE